MRLKSFSSYPETILGLLNWTISQNFLPQLLNSCNHCQTTAQLQPRSHRKKEPRIKYEGSDNLMHWNWSVIALLPSTTTISWPEGSIITWSSPCICCQFFWPMLEPCDISFRGGCCNWCYIIEGERFLMRCQHMHAFKTHQIRTKQTSIYPRRAQSPLAGTQNVWPSTHPLPMSKEAFLFQPKRKDY